MKILFISLFTLFTLGLHANIIVLCGIHPDINYGKCTDENGQGGDDNSFYFASPIDFSLFFKANPGYMLYDVKIDSESNTSAVVEGKYTFNKDNLLDVYFRMITSLSLANKQTEYTGQPQGIDSVQVYAKGGTNDFVGEKSWVTYKYF